MKVYAKVAKLGSSYRIQYKRANELSAYPAVVIASFASRAAAKAYASANGYVLVAKWSDAS